MRRFPFVLVDVFTREPLQGNQLAVFTDARGLHDAELQRLAKETNLSETTFVSPRDAETERRDGVSVRIFTVEEELEFAGHPTLGTAAVLRRGGARTIDLDLRVGKIPVTFTDEGAGRAFGEMRQREPRFGRAHRREDIAPIGGLAADDLRDDVPIQTVSTGMAFAIVPVKTLAAMRRVRLDWGSADRYLQGSDAKFLYFLCTETDSPEAHAHARMVFYNGEDPATGSAAGCAAAWMARYGVAPSGERVMIEQGVEMGRRSEIYVRAERAGEGATDVRVGGYSVEVARGEYVLE